MSIKNVTMSRETFEHIRDNIHRLELDIEKGIIFNRSSNTIDNGYLRTCLNRKKVYFHQVFAVARWGEECVGKQIDHINKCRTDNKIDNLRLVSQLENFQNVEGIIQSPIKAINIETGEEFIFESQHATSRKLGVNQRCVNNIVNGKQKRHKGYTFERVVT